MGEELYELPKGWTIATVGELISVDGIFIDGDWVESKDQDPRGDVRLIQLADVGDGFYRNKSNRYLTREKAIELNCTFLKPGDILVARMPDPLGRCCIFPGDKKSCVTVVDVCIVRTGSQGTNPSWLMYTLNSPQIRLVVASLQSGSTRKRISRSNFAQIKLPVPPLPEQYRIVAKIEELFTELDAGVELLKKLKVKLKRYRQAVLKSAVEGNLTKEWRTANQGKLEPASILLERILKQRREKWEAEQLAKMKAQGKTPKDDSWKLKYKEPIAPDTSELPELPDGWCYTFLNPCLSLSRGMKTGPFGSLLKKHEHQTEGVPVLGIENIANMKFIRGSKIHITKEKAKKLSMYDVQPGDVLVSRSGTVGEVCVVPEDISEARISTNLMRISLFNQSISPDFFCLLFNGSPYVLSQVSELCKGSTRDFLNQDILSSIVFPIPSFTEQKKIIEEVERLFSVTNQLEKTIDSNLKRAEKLRQSILKQAFQGKLVPQDPNDEPAEKLLERIKAEKAKQTITKTKRKTQSKTQLALQLELPLK
jgi:type I restriction enzyme S subunit